MQRVRPPFSRWSLLLLLAACACSAASLDKPAPIHWDRDTCERCDMAIGDRRFAAQIRYGKEVHRFDDFGCALLWQAEHPNAIPTGFWVRDAAEDGWLEASAVHYRKGYATPMGYGFGAVREPSAEDETFDEVWTQIGEIERERRAKQRG
jgi:copper chaperone NosL